LTTAADARPGLPVVAAWDRRADIAERHELLGLADRGSERDTAGILALAREPDRAPGSVSEHEERLGERDRHQRLDQAQRSAARS